MRKIFIIFCVVITLPALAQKGDRQGDIERLDGSTISQDKLIEKIENLRKENKIPGLVVAIFNRHEVVFSEALGFANFPEKEKLDIDTEIYGASLSKAVFSVLVMALVEQGIIDLDRPLQSYLEEPIWKNSGKHWHQNFTHLRNDPRYKKITARMCLSHTTGLPNWRWIEPDNKLKLHFDPGERYSYSGEGMVLLQFVLEKITGKPLEKLAREIVFGPYGMTHSSYTWQASFENKYALGHRSDGSTYPRDKDNSPRAPSTLETNPTDYIRFLQGILHRKNLSSNAYREIFHPQVRIKSETQFGPGVHRFTDAYDSIQLSYGLGWGLFHTEHGWAAFKEGHGEGFQHYSLIYPKAGTGVLLMSNSDNAEDIFGRLLELTIAERKVPLGWEGYLDVNAKKKINSE
ncbi:serine hydrolase domain-containing protein [Microbulbifer sp. ANSA002]|uniref:serine hydrolase domain-containing protein n=1 Tax=unclassified Microbulbifer TaxID=2619833 RepID=UPI0040427528